MTTNTTTPERPVAPPEFDPMSQQSFADPASIFPASRDTQPVFFYEPLGIWVITRRADVEAVLTDWETWANSPPPDTGKGIQVPEVAQDTISPELVTELLVLMDPPKHTVARKTAQRGFLKPMMDALQPEVERRAHRIIDTFAHQGRADLVNAYCLELTTGTIMALLDLPANLDPMMRQLRDDHFEILASAVEPIAEPRRDQVWGRYAEAHRVLRGIVAERRDAGGRDVISLMAGSRDREGQVVLSAERIAMHLCEFAAAGTDTTAQAMANAVLFLSQHPDQLEDAQSDPALWSAVFEETVRRRPSAPFTARRATKDVEIAGTVIPKGEMAWIALASANTDPTGATDPMAFDIHREQGEHFAFTKGRHTCIGAPLARMQGATGLRVLYERLPALSVVPDQELDFLPLAMLPIRRSLAVSWSSSNPAPAPAPAPANQGQTPEGEHRD